MVTPSGGAVPRDSLRAPSNVAEHPQSTGGTQGRATPRANGVVRPFLRICTGQPRRYRYWYRWASVCAMSPDSTQKLVRHEARIPPRDDLRFQQLRARRKLTVAQAWRLVIAAGLDALQQADQAARGER